MVIRVGVVLENAVHAAVAFPKHSRPFTLLCLVALSGEGDRAEHTLHKVSEFSMIYYAFYFRN